MLQGAIENLPDAYAIIKDMEGGNAGEAATQAARAALKEVLEDRMNASIEDRLATVASCGQEDRRNGGYRRQLLTRLGNVELLVPRTRRFSGKGVIGAYVRRAPEVDMAILRCFVLGHSTRKVALALVPLLGEQVSASTVSRVAKTLDLAVQAFHERQLRNRYRALLFDGVVLSRKTGAGSIRRPVLVILGILRDGRKEIIDWRLGQSESEEEWRLLFDNVYRRGLTAEGVEIAVVDGGKGLLAALSTCFPFLPVQRCWAHKVRNITDKVRQVDQEAVRRGLRAIYQASNLTQARRAAGRFARAWEKTYPKAVACLRVDLDQLLTFFRFRDPVWRKAVRTTNAIERRFREVRRRTRPMGVFYDRTSIERILFAVFTHENRSQNVPSLFLMTQKS
jgi:transposase-like protein